MSEEALQRSRKDMTHVYGEKVGEAKPSAGAVSPARCGPGVEKEEVEGGARSCPTPLRPTTTDGNANGLVPNERGREEVSLPTVAVTAPMSAKLRDWRGECASGTATPAPASGGGGGGEASTAYVTSHTTHGMLLPVRVVPTGQYCVSASAGGDYGSHSGSTPSSRQGTSDFNLSTSSLTMLNSNSSSFGSIAVRRGSGSATFSPQSSLTRPPPTGVSPKRRPHMRPVVSPTEPVGDGSVVGAGAVSSCRGSTVRSVRFAMADSPSQEEHAQSVRFTTPTRLVTGSHMCSLTPTSASDENDDLDRQVALCIRRDERTGALQLAAVPHKSTCSPATQSPSAVPLGTRGGASNGQPACCARTEAANGSVLTTTASPEVAAAAAYVPTRFPARSALRRTSRYVTPNTTLSPTATWRPMHAVQRVLRPLFAMERGGQRQVPAGRRRVTERVVLAWALVFVAFAGWVLVLLV